MELDEIFKELDVDLKKVTGGLVSVNLNADIPLTDAEIRERNKKFIAEVQVSDEVRLRNSRGTIVLDDYSKKLPDIGITDPLIDVKTTVDETLNFNKPYNPKEFFVKVEPTPVFIKTIQERLETIYDSPHQVVDGRKVYATYYFNVEIWCLELFFEAINWDVKIVEAVMHEKNNSLRADIASVGFTKLALAARGKK